VNRERPNLVKKQKRGLSKRGQVYLKGIRACPYARERTEIRGHEAGGVGSPVKVVEGNGGDDLSGLEQEGRSNRS